jgi:hypothetical protein
MILVSRRRNRFWSDPGIVFPCGPPSSNCILTNPESLKSSELLADIGPDEARNPVADLP